MTRDLRVPNQANNALMVSGMTLEETLNPTLKQRQNERNLKTKLLKHKSHTGQRRQKQCYLI